MIKKKKFISDLDISRMIELMPLEIDNQENYLLMKAILMLFYGIRINYCFRYERDYNKMGFIIEYN